jgi:hypothetical protein
MRTPPMKTRSALIAIGMTLAIAAPVFSDTLVLRNGRSLSGTLVAANGSAISFQDHAGRKHRYLVTDVDTIQFGDGPYNSGTYNQPRNDGGDNRGDGRNQSYGNEHYGNQGNSGYDQTRMERVVLPPGTEVAVRTNERIDSRDVVEGQTFSAQIDGDIRDNDGSIVIPRGSDVTLVTRRLDADGDITLDVDSITVAGRRYRVSTADQELQNHRDSVGGNERTGQYVGGGATFGAIIGAIAGGGKGAAIGAVSGAGAGAAVQITTRGREVHVPAESVIRFRLDQPLRLRLWS